MWVGKSDSSSFWMGVLTDLKVRGVQDILNIYNAPNKEVAATELDNLEKK